MPSLAHLRSSFPWTTSSARTPTTAVSITSTATAARTATSLRFLSQPTDSPSPASSTRSFSTSRPLLVKTIAPGRLPTRLIPPYPYGERRVYKQSNKGLYGSARIRFGNNVSEKHSVKTQRFWRPNVHVKVFELPGILSTPDPVHNLSNKQVAPTASTIARPHRAGLLRVRTRLTLRVLKTIRREGGLANYLLKSKPARIKELGPGGWNLRWLLMQTRTVQERFNEERRNLGLPEKPVEDRDHIIRYALDYATPGPLSQTSRNTLAQLRMAEGIDFTESAAGVAGGPASFTLGDEALAEVEGVEELSDEDEARLLGELDLSSQEGKTRGAKQTIEA